MEKTLYFDGMDVLQQDIQNTEDTKGAELNRRLLDTARSFGVVANDPSGFDTTLKPFVSAANVISVSPGSAYDGAGEYINYPGSPTTGALTVAFANGDVGNFIVIRYSSIDNTSISHPVTGVANNTRRVDSATDRNPDGTYTGTFYAGYQLLNVTSPLATDVKLGKIIATDGVGGATLDLTPGYSTDGTAVRFVYCSRLAAAGANVLVGDPLTAMIAHINNFGALGASFPHNAHGLTPADIGAAAAGFTLTAHEEDLHDTAMTGDSNPTHLTMSVVSSSVPNGLQVTPLGTPSRVIIAGNEISAINGNSLLSFASASTNASTYQVYMDTTGALQLSKLVDYGLPVSSFNVPGVQILDSSAPAGAYNLSWVASTMALSFGGGTPILLTTAGPTAFLTGQYKLYAANSQKSWVIVHVDYTTLSAVVTNQTMSVTCAATVVTDATFLLGTIFWGGTADGHLGYGAGQTAGAAWDQRLFGNTSIIDLRGDLIHGNIEQRFAETRSNGFVSGGAVTNSGGLLALVSSSVWYVGGARYETDAVTKSLTDNTTNYIYVDLTSFSFGPLAPSIDASIYPSSQLYPANRIANPYLLVATIVTAGGSISSITINAPNLSNIDNRIAALGSPAELHVANIFDAALSDPSIVPNTGTTTNSALAAVLAWGAEYYSLSSLVGSAYFGVGGSQISPIIVNAAKINNTGHWFYANVGGLAASRVEVNIDNIELDTYAGASPWLETAWVEQFQIAGNSKAPTPANISFLMTPGMMVKAWYYFEQPSSGNIYNFTPTAPTSATTYALTFLVSGLFSNAYYAVVPVMAGLSDYVAGDWIQVTSKTTSGFTVGIKPFAGGTYPTNSKSFILMVLDKV